MKLILTAFFCAVSLASTAQIEKVLSNGSKKAFIDRDTRRAFIVDESNQDTITLDFSYVNWLYEKHGFIYVKTGDMKGLCTWEGEVLMEASHFIRFFPKKKIYGGYICGGAQWIYRSFDGEILSQGKRVQNNYLPDISEAENVVYSIEDDKFLIGTIDSNGRWIEPLGYEPKDTTINNEKYMVVKGQVGKFGGRKGWEAYLPAQK